MSEHTVTVAGVEYREFIDGWRRVLKEGSYEYLWKLEQKYLTALAAAEKQVAAFDILGEHQAEGLLSVGNELIRLKEQNAKLIEQIAIEKQQVDIANKMMSDCVADKIEMAKRDGELIWQNAKLIECVRHYASVAGAHNQMPLEVAKRFTKRAAERLKEIEG